LLVASISDQIQCYPYLFSSNLQTSGPFNGEHDLPWWVSISKGLT